MSLNWLEYNDLSKEVGTSFYVAKPEKFSHNFKTLLNEFKKYYPKTNIAYSYKTNYLPKFCAIVNSLKGYAEVVSSMELQLAHTIGVPFNRIFYNGPYKDLDIVVEFLSAGGIVNIDSFEEYFKLSKLASDKHLTVNVGVRCNFDLNDGAPSRFGVPSYANQLETLIEKINLNQSMKLVCLHCHFASRNLDSWRNRTSNMIALLAQMSTDQFLDLKYVSLGGGLYGQMTPYLKRQFKTSIPSFDEYATVSAKEFSDLMLSLNRFDVELIIEPGTALAANAMEFYCSIQSIKSLERECFVTVDGSSFNIGTFKSNVNLPTKVIKNKDKEERTAVKSAKVVGYTCIEQDILHSNFKGEIAIGDVIVFEETGSYSIVMKPPFILPNVAIVEKKVDGNGYKILKRKETFDDIFNTYGY